MSEESGEPHNVDVENNVCGGSRCGQEALRDLRRVLTQSQDRVCEVC